MALAAFLFVLTACENKKAEQPQNKDNQKQEVVDDKNNDNKKQEVVDDKNNDNQNVQVINGPTQKEESPEETPGNIEIIRNVWEMTPIPGIAEKGKVDIERFARAFCYEYSNYEPNKALCDYLKDPKGYNNEDYRIDNQKSNGYIKCQGMFQVSWDVTGCYWNRDNGHKLVAFWLEQGHESDPELADALVVFYDYDPAKDVMTPEPALGKAIEKAMAHYDTYSVVLPDKGKDIELVGYKIDYKNDSAEPYYYIYRWNGNDFKLEKAKD